MLARLVRGCIALAFTAGVRAVATSHRLADPVKGSELSYMTLALQREPTAYRSLLTRAGAVLADPEPMLSRLVRGCIALAFTAGVHAVATSHRLADPIKGSELSLLHDGSNGTRENRAELATDTCWVLADPEPMQHSETGGKEDDPTLPDGDEVVDQTVLAAQDAADVDAVLGQLMRTALPPDQQETTADRAAVLEEVSALLASFNQTIQDEAKDRKYRFHVKRLLKAHLRAGDAIDPDLDLSQTMTM